MRVVAFGKAKKWIRGAAKAGRTNATTMDHTDAAKANPQY